MTSRPPAMPFVTARPAVAGDRRERIARLAARALDARAVILATDRGDDAVLVSVAGDTARVDGVDVPGLLAMLRQAGGPVLIDRAGAGLAEVAGLAADGALALWPIATAAGPVCGCLCVIREPGPHWTEDDRATLADLAALAATEEEQSPAADTTGHSVAMLLETVSIGVAVFDADGRFTYANPAARQILRQDEHTILAATAHGGPWQVIGRDGTALAREQMPFFQVKRTLAPVRDVVFGVRTEGHEDTYVSVNSTPLFDADGEFVGAVATFTDISERLEAEAALTTSERRFRTLVSTAPTGIVQVDERGTLLFANEAWARLTGRPVEEQIGLHWTAAVHPDDLDRLTRAWRATERPIESERHAPEFRLRRPDGSVSWVSMSAVPLRNAAGATVAYIGTAADVSRRRQAEEDLARFFDLSPDGLCILDAGGVFLRVSPALEQMLGLPATEIVGRTPLDFLPADEHDAARAALAQILAGRPVLNREFRFQRGDGSYMWIAWTVAAVTTDGVLYAVARDVREQRRASAALRRNEAWLRALIENSTDVISVLDRNGTICFVSPAAARLGQRSIAEIVGKPFDWNVHPDDVARVREIFARVVITEGASEPFDLREQRSDGEWRQYQAVAVNLLHVPEIDGVVTITRDVTDLRAREQALRETEARSKHLIEHATDIIYETDTEGRFRFVNSVVTRLLGYDVDDLLGRRYLSIVHPEWRRSTGRFYLHQVRDRTPTTYFEFPAVAKDGRVVWFGQNLRLVFEGDQVVGPHFSTRDITERRQAEERLHGAMRTLEAQYREADRARGEARAVLDSTQEAIAFVQHDRGVLTVNRRFSELFAIPPEEVVGRRFEQLRRHIEQLVEDGGEFYTSVLDTFSDDTSTFGRTVTLVRPVRRELELTSAPVRSDDGEFLGRLYVFRDVTREREVDRMKTEFVSLVSHELRTPLTSIAGYVELLVQGEVGPLTDDQRDFLAVVKTNADRLTGLINDLLDISRIEAGKIELELTTVDLGDLAATVAGMLRPQIEAKGQSLQIEIDPAAPRLTGDSDRLAQVITNLLSNAHKYTPAGGTIVVRVAPAADTRRTVRIAVADTGIGMTEEEQTRLFTKFYRAQNETTRAVGGTGLGLAITRQLVELHGGEISVRSAPSAGSTFTVTFPARDDDGEAGATAGSG
jgi:PAS domain S-box-containing protein